MYDYLDAKRFPEADDCEVLIETVTDDPTVKASGGNRQLLHLGSYFGLVVVVAMEAFWGVLFI